ncbi:c-type cytochrome [Pseudomonas prosekii]|uniref:c-type cytochrome n=1 Tax=Pseudomonas prosekii TaxID=1148509 RepID=UPI0021CCB537|nr:c-type cytochrome [Pseudomonas prosekii]
MKRMLVAAFLFACSTAHAVQNPEDVFNRTCSKCHDSRFSQAPKKGDLTAWNPRLEKGKDILVKHVTEGFNAMPPRGLCMDCSAEDYEAVITWMSK